MTSAIAVLHLEDDPADARLIREQLRRSGLNAEISLARDRPAFEEAFFGRKFDVILSDFHVPGINGDEALQLVRATDLHIPFILVTGALGKTGRLSWCEPVPLTSFSRIVLRDWVPPSSALCRNRPCGGRANVSRPDFCRRSD